MCGIVAVIATKQLSPHLIDAMRDRLEHRGPDGCGTWVSSTHIGGVGLGHRRLSILDLSKAAAQPMVSECGRFVLSYNGEIYNYIELRKELEGYGICFHTGSDTEVLLNAFAFWGESCLEHLNGMFAFIIWDNKEQRAFVARDRFGEKPLYFAKTPSGIALASEIKALLIHPDITVQQNEEILSNFLKGIGNYYGDATFYEGIKKFPAASATYIDATGQMQTPWRYWTPNFSPVEKQHSHRAVIEEFGHRLETSLKQRFRSDVGVGAMLSGGLDSSTLVGLSHKLGLSGLHDKCRTFSAVFNDDRTVSEKPHIDLVLNSVDCDPYFIEPNPNEMVKEFEKLHWHQEEPFLSASMYLEWCVLRKAKQQGCTVMIDGQGADEILGGYQYYFNYRQLDWLVKKQRRNLNWNTFWMRYRLAREARKYANPQRRFNAKMAYNFAQLRCYRKYGVSLDYEERIGVPSPENGNYFRYQLANGLLYDMMPSQLHSADRNAMAFGVESRFPFLDYELVDWITTIAPDHLIRNGWQKEILRQTASKVLPSKVTWRPEKIGFSAPQDAWLRGPLRNWARDRLHDPALKALEGYNQDYITCLWAQHQSGKIDRSWDLWRWISTSQWLELISNGTWKESQQKELYSLSL